MDITKANIGQVDIIMVLLELVKNNMHHKKIFQWDDAYPSRQDIIDDINLDQLYLLKENNKIIAVFVLTEIMDIEYKDIDWMTKDGNNIYVHRMAILPSEQGKGWGKKIMKWIHKYAMDNNYISVRLDTFVKNKYSNILFESIGYKKMKKIMKLDKSDRTYYCYEYVLKK